MFMNLVGLNWKGCCCLRKRRQHFVIFT